MVAALSILFAILHNYRYHVGAVFPNEIHLMAALTLLVVCSCALVYIDQPWFLSENKIAVWLTLVCAWAQVVVIAFALGSVLDTELLLADRLFAGGVLCVSVLTFVSAHLMYFRVLRPCRKK
jgi:hypothetical protein